MVQNFALAAIVALFATATLADTTKETTPASTSHEEKMEAEKKMEGSMKMDADKKMEGSMDKKEEK